MTAICRHMHEHMLYVYAYLSICLSIYLPIYLSIYVYIYIYIHTLWLVSFFGCRLENQFSVVRRGMDAYRRARACTNVLCKCMRAPTITL